MCRKVAMHNAYGGDNNNIICKRYTYLDYESHKMYLIFECIFYTTP